MATIVSHVSPDWDAICALWLLQRYGGLADADIVLVPSGEAGPPDAAAVVDTGRTFDPGRGRFDHHQFPGAQSSATCAARQVYEWIVDRSTETPADWAYLLSIIDLVTAGDAGLPAAALSRQVGIHALLSVRKAARYSDEVLIAWGQTVLDELALHLRGQDEARRTLAAHTVWRSADGCVVALESARPPRHTPHSRPAPQSLCGIAPCHTYRPRRSARIGHRRVGSTSACW